MEPNRTSGLERRQPRKDRHDYPDSSHRGDDRQRAKADQNDDLDGQLGPDELPDADEVAMNLEAKRHH
jgi:hypothetical protein